MKQLIIIFFMLASLNSYSQKYQTYNGVQVPENATIIKTVKVKNCPQKVDSSFIVKTEFQKKNGDKTYIFTKIDTLTKDTFFSIEKEIKIEMKSFGGVANLTIDKGKKSKISVDYWLNKQNKISKGTTIKIIKRTLNCPKGNKPKNSDYTEKETLKTLKNDTVFYLVKIPYNKKIMDLLKNIDWYINLDLIIEVYKSNGSIDYVLVNKYDRDGKYELKLKKREFISYKEKGLDFGPLTIPFKNRSGYTKDSIEVKQEFNTDVNLGVFCAYRFGRYRARYEGNGFKELANVSVSIGAFVSLSSATLNKSSTTTGKEPITGDESYSIGVLSPGIGIMLDVYNVNIGLFYGKDIGFGSEAKNWNFNNKQFWGIGLGYNLNGF